MRGNVGLKLQTCQKSVMQVISKVKREKDYYITHLYTWRYPFQAEPPRIGPFTEYPSRGYKWSLLFFSVAAQI